MSRLLDLYLADLRLQGFVPEEDISFIAISEPLFQGVVAPRQHCPVRGTPYKHYAGIEFRISATLPPLRTPEALRGRTAWRITPRTRALFKGLTQRKS